MELTISRNSLVEALSLAMPYATAKTPVAITRYGKCTTKGNRLKIEANDMQGGIVRYIDLENCDCDASFLMDVAETSKFVAKLKDDVISLKVDGNTLTICHKKGAADFQIPSPDEYPSFSANDEDMFEVAIPSSTLSESVKIAKDFVSTEALRPQMTAIYFYINNGVCGVCATDTHCLINYESPIDVVSEDEKSFLIMPNVFSAILASSKESEQCVLSFNEKHVRYRFGNTIIQSNQAQGRFPMFRRVIPQSHSIECVADKIDLADAASRASLFCEDSTCLVLGINRMDMTFTADNINKGKKSYETVVHNGCNGEINIGMNSAFFNKCLKAFPSGEICLQMNDSTRPMVFHSDAMPHLIALAMPLAIIGN